MGLRDQGSRRPAWKCCRGKAWKVWPQPSFAYATTGLGTGLYLSEPSGFAQNACPPGPEPRSGEGTPGETMIPTDSGYTKRRQSPTRARIPGTPETNIVVPVTRFISIADRSADVGWSIAFSSMAQTQTSEPRPSGSGFFWSTPRARRESSTTVSPVLESAGRSVRREGFSPPEFRQEPRGSRFGSHRTLSPAMSAGPGSSPEQRVP